MTAPGFDRPLYLLPFDHRASYLKGMFGWQAPLDAAQQAQVEDSKRLIYEGFLQALTEGVPVERAGILVDEEFGAALLRDAKARGVMTALPVEGSGSDEFHFQYGEDFARHIRAFAPDFAKVLVRYNVEGDAALNARQTERLLRLSQHCRSEGPHFMFELLVPPTPGQLARVDGDKQRFDRELRPALMARAMRALQDAGVEPDVWKIEGLEDRADCDMLARLARRDGRDAVGCILLGRAAEAAQVDHWLRTAASVPGFIGFAVGRTTFWEPVAAWRDKAIPRAAAAGEISRHFRRWIAVFEQAGQDLPR